MCTYNTYCAPMIASLHKLCGKVCAECKKRKKSKKGAAARFVQQPRQVLWDLGAYQRFAVSLYRPS